jgi:hypothetical protein
MSDCDRLYRRDFLRMTANGLVAGGLGLRSIYCAAAAANEGHPLAPKPAHFEPKAKQLVFIFLTGGFSHIETFDPKPVLSERAGAKEKWGWIKPSLFKFDPYGESGLPISELFPHLGARADDLCVIRSMHTDNGDHFQATLQMHTGSFSVPRPSLGSWLSYGLGTQNRNLPSYMVLAKYLPYAGGQVWDSSFLPPYHQGVRILPGDKPIENIESPNPQPASLRDLERRMFEDVNKAHAELRKDGADLKARMTSFEIAQGMMGEAPQVFDLSTETDATLAKYGFERGDKESFGWQCLVARRMIESGVRVVELIDTGASDNWDEHGDMERHRKKALYVDQAIGALIGDLKERGKLAETLVVITTEFGRGPFISTPEDKGRNHHKQAFSTVLAGGGVKGGFAYGQSDEFGQEVAENPVHVHDLHATILHLMGFDHERLTYRYGGRDFRLTDVHGNVVHDLIA